MRTRSLLRLAALAVVSFGGLIGGAEAQDLSAEVQSADDRLVVAVREVPLDETIESLRTGEIDAAVLATVSGGLL